MIVILSNMYPDYENFYQNAFVHKRVCLYQKRGYDIVVLCPSHERKNYEIDGVKVYKGNQKYLYESISKYKIDVVFVHFLTKEIFEIAESLPVKNDIIKYVWVHGFEAESWHRRHFIFSESAIDLLKIVSKKESFNDVQLNLFKMLFTTNRNDYRFIHVSNWFKNNVVEMDVGFTTPNNTIIPNPIDADVFCYTPKQIEQRYKILSIRPFASTKYANDITVKTIELLSKSRYFHQMDFLICGDGIHFENLTAPLKKFTNVRLRKEFFSQKDIANLHKEYGIFLCPTRWDSQGVSMCEAMSSGMVVVTSNVSAIPEFVTDNVSGLLSQNTPEDFAAKIIYIIENPELFKSISEKSSELIYQICGSENVIDRELSLIKNVPEKICSQKYQNADWQQRYEELDYIFFKTLKGIFDDTFLAEMTRIYLLSIVKKSFLFRLFGFIIAELKVFIKKILKK